ncbi:MAG: hypothetical protein AB1894_23980 [Chloroflexota bacterium]
MSQAFSEQDQIRRAVHEFRAAEQRRQVAEGSAEAVRQQETLTLSERSQHFQEQEAAIQLGAKQALDQERLRQREAVADVRQAAEKALAQVERLESNIRQSVAVPFLEKLLRADPESITHVVQPLVAMQDSLEQAQVVEEQILSIWNSRRKTARDCLLVAMIYAILGLITMIIVISWFLSQVVFLP